MSITTLLIPILVAIIWLLSWAARRIFRQFKSGEPIGAKHSLVMLSSAASLAFIWCFGFFVWASLGHSAHPLADVWLECLAGIIIFILLPIAFLAWCHYRNGKKTSFILKRK